MATSRDDIQLGIYLDAVNALKSVDELTKDAKSLQRVFDELTIAAKNFSQKTGLNLSQVGDIFSNILRQGESLRSLISQTENPNLTLGRLPKSVRDVAQIDLFKGKDILSNELEKSLNTGYKLNDAIRVLRSELASSAAGMEQTNKEAAKAAQNLGKAAQEAQLLAVYTKQGLANLNFSNAKNYVANVQSLMVGIKRVRQETGATFKEIGSYIEQNFKNVPKVAITDAIKGLNNELRGTKKGFEDAGTSAKGFQQVLHLIRGTLVAVGVFQILQGIQESFAAATKGARELELSLYNLANAERLLSQQGIGISPQDLKDITTEVQKMVPIFSRVDVSNAIAGIALFTKDLGLSKEQIEDLSKSIAILTVRNRAFGLSFEQVRSQVLTGILTGRAQGIRDLGVSVSETTIQAEALRLGLVEDEKAFNDLTGEMEAHVKAQALVSVITKSTTGEIGTLNEYLSTSDARIESNKAAWEDFLTVIGQGINNLVPDLTKFIEYLQKAAEQGNLRALIRKSLEDQPYFIGRERLRTKVALGIKLTEKEYAKLKETLSKLSKDEILDLFPDPSAIKDRFVRELIQSLVPATDTATGALKSLADDGFGAVDDALDKVNFDDFLEDMQKLQERLDELEREFQEKMSRMDEDFKRDQERDLEDYQRDVAKTIQDFNDKRHDAEQKYRLQEAEAEARFQETLRQLRENFLFGLEDALRERDARQVLRLIKEYQMEKQNLTNEEMLRKEFAARQHAEEMARLRREEAERLALLAEEFRVKQERARQDYELKKQREIEDHQQDMEDIRQQMEDRLKEFEDALIKELGLKGQAAEDLRKLLNDYYGEGGAYDKLYTYSAESLKAKTAQLLADLLAMYSQAQSLSTGFTGDDWWNNNNSSINNSVGDKWWDDIGNQKEGGVYLANRPTKAVFGDAGPEMAAFLPIKNVKQGIKLPSLAGGGSMGGNLSMRIMLDSGLVATIVDQSLENVSAIIEEVQRQR